MADFDIEQVVDLYSDPHPGDAALARMIAQLDEMDRADAAAGKASGDAG